MNAVLESPLCIQIDERPSARGPSRYELRFAPLFGTGREYAFPCDTNANVDIDRLTDRARANYFYARTTIGREFCSPVTCNIVVAGRE